MLALEVLQNIYKFIKITPPRETVKIHSPKYVFNIFSSIDSSEPSSLLDFSKKFQ